MNEMTFIFDFDGTIADTVELMKEIAYKLVKEYNFPPLSERDITKLRNSKSEEIIRFFKVPLFKVPFFINRFRAEFGLASKNIEPVSGIAVVLETLKKSGHKLGIVTSNSDENVHAFLAKYDLNFFDFIQTCSSLFGKAGKLRKIIKSYALDKGSIIYVGDETRDIDAARKSDIKVASATWGYNAKGILQSLQPDYLLDHPDELLTIASL